MNRDLIWRDRQEKNLSHRILLDDFSFLIGTDAEIIKYGVTEKC